jgi:hypothetical protein
MGERFQTIVDTEATLEEADHLARHVVAFLTERGVLGRPSEEGGYARGPNALAISEREPHPENRPAVHEPIPPVYFHLQVVIGRNTQSSDLNEFQPPRASCPACGKSLEDLEAEWVPAAQAWIAGDTEASLACPSCGKITGVSRWAYGSGYGFGNLAFRFWNWPPFTREFLDLMAKELGHPIARVEGKMG